METSKLIEALEKVTNDPSSLDEDTRGRLLVAARNACSGLETAWEKMAQVLWVNGPMVVTLRVADNLQILQKLSAASQTVTQLAEQTNSSPDVLESILYSLSTIGLVRYCDEDNHFVVTAQGKEFARDQGLANASWYLHEVLWPMHQKMPGYFNATQYHLPSDNTIWKYTSGGDKPFYPWLLERPETATKFHSVMSSYTDSKTPPISVYPWQELTQNVKPDRPLIVDVGGGQGYNLKKARTQLQNHSLGAGLVLQDQADVIESINKQDLGPHIQCVAHDLLSPQPVRGARVYFLGNIILNWPEEQAVQILRNLKEVLDPEYSSIVISEAVLGGHPYAGPASLTMMGLFAGRLRDWMGWVELAEKAGLSMLRLVSKPNVLETIVELVA